MKNLCNKLENELTGLNKQVCILAIKEKRFEELVLTFGQQAVTDAPKSMQKILTKQTYKELVSMYKTLTI